MVEPVVSEPDSVVIGVLVSEQSMVGQQTVDEVVQQAFELKKSARRLVQQTYPDHLTCPG